MGMWASAIQIQIGVMQCCFVLNLSLPAFIGSDRLPNPSNVMKLSSILLLCYIRGWLAALALLKTEVRSSFVSPFVA